MEAETKNYGLAFSNYNVAFEYFHQSFKKQCEVLSKTRNIETIRRSLQTFISEFSYALEDTWIAEEIKKELTDLKVRIDYDKELQKLLAYDNPTLQQEAEYLVLFYKYYIPHLKILARFTYHLSVSLMPNTSKQKKLIRFSNNNPFFNRLMEFKRSVSESISEFKIKNFRAPLNYTMVLFYAYSLFITKEDREFIEEKLSAIRGVTLSSDILKILVAYPNLSISETQLIQKADRLCFLGLLEINEKVNQSFGKYGVLPEINKKVEGDRHGI